MCTTICCLVSSNSQGKIILDYFLSKNQFLLDSCLRGNDASELCACLMAERHYRHRHQLEELQHPALKLPSPACGRGAGGEGEQPAGMTG